MDINSMERAEEYYKLVGEKNERGLEKYLHPDIEFLSPLFTLKGKEAVIEAITKFMNAFQSLTIRAKFGAKDQAMIVYDVEIPGIAKKVPTASLLHFRELLIVRIQLFYDGSQFLEKK